MTERLPINEPGKMAAAARAAGMPVIDYWIKHAMPTQARALMARHRAECERRGVPFEPPVFVCTHVNDQLEGLTQ